VTVVRNINEAIKQRSEDLDRGRVPRMFRAESELKQAFDSADAVVVPEPWWRTLQVDWSAAGMFVSDTMQDDIGGGGGVPRCMNATLAP
jgi:hypothetical protein